MRSTRLFILPLLIVTLLALTAAKESGQAADNKQLGSKETTTRKIDWQAYDIGLSKAKVNNKHVFIDFTAEWCGWCKKMDRETFADPKVVDMLNEYFVPIKVDGDSKHELLIDGYKITEKNLARNEYGVRSYPIYWVLESDGTKLTYIKGYKPVDYMMEVLEYIKDRRYDSTSTETPEQKKKSSN
ncbi:MAG: DUF255 domain-containing protein [bacterium]